MGDLRSRNKNSGSLICLVVVHLIKYLLSWKEKLAPLGQP